MSGCGSVEHGSVCPGGVFVVGCSVFEAGMEDAYEPVGEGSEDLVVFVVGCFSFVVEGSRALTVVEGPLAGGWKHSTAGPRQLTCPRSIACRGCCGPGKKRPSTITVPALPTDATEAVNLIIEKTRRLGGC